MFLMIDLALDLILGIKFTYETQKRYVGNPKYGVHTDHTLQLVPLISTFRN